VSYTIPRWVGKLHGYSLHPNMGWQFNCLTLFHGDFINKTVDLTARQLSDTHQQRQCTDRKTICKVLIGIWQPNMWIFAIMFESKHQLQIIPNLCSCWLSVLSDIRDGWWLMITHGDQTWQREMNMFIQIKERSIELAHFQCWQCMDSKNGPMAIDTSAYGYGPTIDFEKHIWSRTTSN